MSTCETCRFWSDGICNMVGEVESREPNNDRNAFEINVRVADDHGLTVELRTGPDFGCVKHQSIHSKIFEGWDHKKQIPLFQVNFGDYVGEWHTVRADAEKELEGIK